MKRGSLIGVGIATVSVLVLVLIGLFLAAVPRPETGNPSEVPSVQTGKSSWYPDFILTFDGHRYTVSTSRITGVGSYLGGTSYHGLHSGGFGLYAIPKIPDHEAIAVQTKSGYLLAIENR